MERSLILLLIRRSKWESVVKIGVLYRRFLVSVFLAASIRLNWALCISHASYFLRNSGHHYISKECMAARFPIAFFYPWLQALSFNCASSKPSVVVFIIHGVCEGRLFTIQKMRNFHWNSLSWHNPGKKSSTRVRRRWAESWHLHYSSWHWFSARSIFAIPFIDVPRKRPGVLLFLLNANKLALRKQRHSC